MAEAKGKVASPEHSLTRMFYEEAMTPFLVLSLIMGTAGCAAVILVWRISAFGYVGLVGVSSAAMWMPYLMALIYFNTDKGTMFTGLYKKLAYAPLPAEIPPWVKRGMVAHNNSLENFMLFATSVIFACLMMKVPEKEVRAAAAFYFVCRTYYYIFTVAPAIFMLKTAFWCMGWGACTFIFVKGLLECKSVYDL
ncbi:hypothetical protein RI054_15g73780 [Pseudoscourfieldia marina]